jgi:hypothetical protein
MSVVRDLAKQDLKKVVCSIKKLPDDYDKAVVKAMKAILAPHYKMYRFGTSMYKYLIYAGDVDLYQKIPVPLLVKSMQDTVKRLLENGFIIGDIKAGIKYEHKELGYLVGTIQNGKPVGYDGKELRNYAKKHHIKDLYNVPDNPTFNQWLEINTIIHLFLTLRFSPKDILKGSITQDGKTYSLKDTILYNWVPPYSLDKIDCYVMSDKGRLIEVTNIYNVPVDSLGFSIQIIKLSIFDNLYIKKDYAKALKRAYTIARDIGDEEMLKKLVPFMISKINCGLSFLTDIKTALTILEKNDFKNVIEPIRIHLKSLLIRMKGYDVFDIVPFSNMIIKALSSKNDKEKVIYYLEKFKKDIQPIFNKITLDYINKMKIDLTPYTP